MIKILIGTLLVLSITNALAGNIDIYKDRGAQGLFTNAGNNLEEMLKDGVVTIEKVKVRKANYDVDESKGNEPNQTSSEMKGITYKKTTSLDRVTKKSAYLALREPFLKTV